MGLGHFVRARKRYGVFLRRLATERVVEPLQLLGNSRLKAEQVAGILVGALVIELSQHPQYRLELRWIDAFHSAQLATELRHVARQLTVGRALLPKLVGRHRTAFPESAPTQSIVETAAVIAAGVLAHATVE